MRKIILSVAVVFAVAISSNAQDQKTIEVTSVTSAATKLKQEKPNTKLEVMQLMKILEMKDFPKNGIFELFSYKNKVMNSPESSPAKKREFLVIFDQKLRSILDAKSYEKLRAEKEYYNKITSDPTMELRRTK